MTLPASATTSSIPSDTQTNENGFTSATGPDTFSRPRYFELPSSELAKQAHVAYSSHPLYYSAVEESIKRVAPFLQRKDSVRGDETKLSQYLAPTKQLLSSDMVSSQERSHHSSVCFELPRSGSHFKDASDGDLLENLRRLRSGSVTHNTASGVQHPVCVGPQDTLPPEAVFDLAQLQTTLSSIVPEQLRNLYDFRSIATCTWPARTLNPYQRIRSLSTPLPRSNPLHPLSVDPAYELTRFCEDTVKNFYPCISEMEEKKLIRAEFEQILQAIQPNATVCIFGSVGSGLSIANSDMDLMVSSSAKVTITSR